MDCTFCGQFSSDEKFDFAHTRQVNKTSQNDKGENVTVETTIAECHDCHNEECKING